MNTPYSPTKVYLAAPFEERAVMMELKDQLNRRGVIVTSTWLTDADGNTANMAAIADKHNECRMRATKDYEDIDAADVFILWKPKYLHKKPTTGGHQVETGYAQAKGKPIVIVGARENVFHYRHGVTVVPENDLYALCSLLHVPFDVPVEVA